MTKYIIRDITAVLRFLPYGLIVGIIVAIVVSIINDRRVKKGKKPVSVVAITAFIMYAVVLLFITFWSRQDGSSVGINLELFSTWGINLRNNAYVIENILLFVPYGFLCAWVFKPARNVLLCTVIGAVTSLGIEWLQLITGRGFFQTDDAVTNTIGALIGCLVFRILMLLPRRK